MRKLIIELNSLEITDTVAREMATHLFPGVILLLWGSMGAGKTTFVKSLCAELIQVQTDNEEVVSMIAKGSLEKPAKYIQSQENQTRFIEATATLITYDVDEGMIFLVGNAHLVQGFDSFSGDTLNYDINNDKVVVKGSEDGT